MSEAAANNNKLDSMEEIASEKDDVTIHPDIDKAESAADTRELSEAEVNSLLDSMDDLGDDLDSEFNDLLGEDSPVAFENDVEDLTMESSPAASVAEIPDDDNGEAVAEKQEQVAPVPTPDEKETLSTIPVEMEDKGEENDLLDEWENTSEAEDLFGESSSPEESDDFQDPDTELLDSTESAPPVSETPSRSPAEKQAPPSASVIPLHQESTESADPVLGVPEITSGAGSESAKSGGIIGFVAIVVSMIALSFGVFGMWLINGLDTEMEQLRRAVAEVSTQAETESQDKTKMRNAITAIGLINARLDEMGLQIAGLRTDAVKRQIDFEESVRKSVDQIQEKMATLEASMAEKVANKRPLEKQVKTPSVNAKSSKTRVHAVVQPVEKASGWVVNLGTFSGQQQAAREMRRLRGKGVKVEIFPLQKEGRSLYRVGVGGFVSYEKAKEYVRSLQQKTGISGAWVGKAG